MSVRGLDAADVAEIRDTLALFPHVFARRISVPRLPPVGRVTQPAGAEGGWLPRRTPGLTKTE